MVSRISRWNLQNRRFIEADQSIFQLLREPATEVTDFKEVIFVCNAVNNRLNSHNSGTCIQKELDNALSLFKDFEINKKRKWAGSIQSRSVTNNDEKEQAHNSQKLLFCISPLRRSPRCCPKKKRHYHRVWRKCSNSREPESFLKREKYKRLRGWKTECYLRENA